MPTPRVIDLSHHNSIPKDLLEAKEAGIIGCIHKLTEGSSHVDDKVQARHYLATQAGMAWGLYHFLRPGDMDQQAMFFLDKAHELGVIDPNTVLVADHEDQSVSGEELKRFLDAIEEMSGRSPVVYSGHVLKEQLEGTGYHPKRRLWLCQYTSGTPTLPEGVDAYWLWQYTDSGEIPGVDPPTDLNHFEGDAEEFLAGWSGAYQQPPEPTPPEVPTVMLTCDVPITLRIVAGENVTIVGDAWV
jgi:lysozyme